VRVQAFAFQSGRHALKVQQRNIDREQKRLHVPLPDRSDAEPPPVMVAVVGPPKVGKSTLIRSLVRFYTKQNLTDIKGPVTVVAGAAAARVRSGRTQPVLTQTRPCAGRKRRLTFFECGNDMASMVDCAKVADLVLLLIDASFGFEMVQAGLGWSAAHGYLRGLVPALWGGRGTWGLGRGPGDADRDAGCDCAGAV
jgi:ribosome biogenesis protein BMS1